MGRMGLGPPAAMINELVYADDTLVLACEDLKKNSSPLKAIAQAGANYGLVLKRKNVEAMLVRCDAAICKPDGSRFLFFVFCFFLSFFIFFLFFSKVVFNLVTSSRHATVTWLLKTTWGGQRV